MTPHAKLVEVCNNLMPQLFSMLFVIVPALVAFVVIVALVRFVVGAVKWLVARLAT